MIEIKDDVLEFSFPEVHPSARLRVEFQRTLRIPDDGRDHSLPPGLGEFPLRHVDDMSGPVPPAWESHGGVVLPMYQSEAMWLNFHAEWDDERDVRYPFAVQIAAGKLNAATGEAWSEGLSADPQDYLVVPQQPWLDGFCVDKGVIRQFVAMPLGSGYSAEEQITGKAEHGGVQIAVRPMKREVFERRFPQRESVGRYEVFDSGEVHACCSSGPDMGLGAGGRMRQEIYDDPYDIDDWESETRSRCFVHLCNSLVWRALEGNNPPSPPPTAREYDRYGLPWFDWYDDKHAAIDATEVLRKLKSVREIGEEKGDVPLPENESVKAERVVSVGPARRGRQVREM